MTKLSFQDALLKGYKQFCFRNKVYDLDEKNYQDCLKKKSDRDIMYLVDTEVQYGMTIKPEEVVYNATEDLFEGCYFKVIESKEYKVWKDQTEKFVKSVQDITTTYNVTEVELI